MCAKYHDSSSNRAWDMHIQIFQLIAIAPPIGALGSPQIAFFLVPPYTPLPSLGRIWGFLHELCWWRADRRTDTQTHSSGRITPGHGSAYGPGINVSEYQHMREAYCVRHLWDIYNQKYWANTVDQSAQSGKVSSMDLMGPESPPHQVW